MKARSIKASISKHDHIDVEVFISGRIYMELRRNLFLWRVVNFWNSLALEGYGGWIVGASS